MGAERDIPVLKTEVLAALPNEPQPRIDEASAKLYEEANKSIVKIGYSNGRGSTGFVVGDGSHVLTTATNIGESKEQTAIGPDGKRYKLELEKMDDLTNLALMKIKKGEIPGTKPLEFGDTQKLNSDDRVWALSFPRAIDSSKPYLSPGYVRGVDLPINLLSSMNPELPVLLQQKLHGMDLEKGGEAGAYLMQPLLDTRLHVEIGSGGAPVLDDKGKVIGIVSMTNGMQAQTGDTLSTPVEYAQGLMDGKGKFEFKYKASGADWAETHRSNWENDKTQAILETTAGGFMAGITAVGASRFPVIGAIAAGGYGLVNLTSDTNRFLTSTESADSWKYGLSAVSDLGTISGAAMMLTQNLRGYGLALASVGLAGRLATDFIRNRWVLDDRSRLEGDPKRPPFNLDDFLKH